MQFKREREPTVSPHPRRLRRRKRTASNPESYSPEKREAINRLFRRRCSLESENQRQEHAREDYERQQRFNFDYDRDDDLYGNENEDPLLNTVPVNMDPEALGYLVCAQVTLRFLHGRGFPPDHPVYARLRSTFVRGINDIAVA